MRIGLVVEQFDRACGGLEQWSVQFADEMLRRGHEIHVASRRFAESLGRMPIVAHRLESARGRLAFADAAQRAVKPLGLDVVHDMGAGWYCDVLQPHGGSREALFERTLEMAPGWLRPWKRVASHLLPRYREFRRLMAQQFVDDGRIVIALSRWVSADFQRFHQVPAGQIRLVYNGVDTDRFTPESRSRLREPVRRRLGIADDTLLLMIIAHNFRLKGVPTLLEAVRRMRLSGRRVHLVVVGGKRTAAAEVESRRLGIGDSVTFAGSTDDTVPFYAAADVYVQPTFYDPCSLVALEALASGLPVVTSRFNGVSELLTEGVDGYVIANPAEPAELLSKLDPLFDPARRARVGQRARQTALAHTFARNCDEIEAIYREVVARRVAVP